LRRGCGDSVRRLKHWSLDWEGTDVGIRYLRNGGTCGARQQRDAALDSRRWWRSPCGSRPEVGDATDRWARHVSGRGRRSARLRGLLLLGQTRWRGPKPRRGGMGRRKREQERPAAGLPAHADETEREIGREPGWAKREKRRDWSFFSNTFLFSFLNSNQI